MRSQLLRILALGTLSLALATLTLCTSESLAKPPGGGGGGGPAAMYTIIPFRPLGYQTKETYVTDLNEVSHAVGNAELPDGTKLALHLDVATGVYTALVDGTFAEGVNNQNQIVGGRSTADGIEGLFWANPSAAPVVLPPLPGDVDSPALAINDAGLVVGLSINATDIRTGVVWRVVVDEGGTAHIDGPVALAPLGDGSDSGAVDVNEVIDGSALVAGETWFGSSAVREAVVWSVGLNPDGTIAVPGPPEGLGTLGLDDPSDSFATAINDIGDVSGESDGWPVVAPAAETIQPLALPRNTVRGRAEDVNESADVVGWLRIKRNKFDTVLTSPSYAYLWHNGEPLDLEQVIDRESGWDALWGANVINNAGVIAGWGRFDVNNRGFLLIPNSP
jgi:hypothetical protein